MAKRLTSFGQWFKASGRTYDDVAAEIGVTHGAIRHYAYGRAIPRPATLAKLCALTGLPAEALLFPKQKTAA